MRLVNTLVYSAIAAIILASCQKEKEQVASNVNDDNNSVSKPSQGDEELLSGNGNNRGFVYTLSNQANGNKVITYRRAANGSLTYIASFAAGGNGTGGGLGNQGAVVIADGDVLLAVNAGSNTISSFKITGNGLNLKSTFFGIC